jgi:hypothetical protein
MRWIHLSIRDVDVPDRPFKEGWSVPAPEIHRHLARGKKIVIQLSRLIGMQVRCQFVKSAFGNSRPKATPSTEGVHRYGAGFTPSATVRALD